MKKILLAFTVILYVVIYLTGSLTPWENLAVCFFVYYLLAFLHDLGKRIVILDLTVMMAIFTCLLMPVVFYHEFTRENILALIWRKYMPISSDDYFSFAVPAILALVLGFRIPIGRRMTPDKNPAIYVENAKKYLVDKPRLGLILIVTGVISGLLDFLVPASLKEIFYLTAHLTFVGVFYVIYSSYKAKRLIVIGVLLLVIGQSILTGMFGEFIFILACSLVLLLLGKEISYGKKLGFAVIGLFLIVLIQSIKADYRKRNWTEGEGASPVYFAELIADRIISPSTMFDPKALFVTSVRMNQGWLVAKTMDMVPERHPFGNGEPLLEAVAASIVPRFLWAGKPEAGGKDNLKRFWGFNLVGWSTNIGTLGEAYANFDRTGGIIYMFFYGLFFNLMLSTILGMCKKRPTLILWIPFLFFSAIAVETDLLTTMGALVKGVIFSWIVIAFFRNAYRIDL